MAVVGNVAELSLTRNKSRTRRYHFATERGSTNKDATLQARGESLLTT
jgi:hypothetical protein